MKCKDVWVYSVCFLALWVPLSVSGAVVPGFDSGVLNRNDDDSTPLTPIGFDINFYGQNYDSLYVNNNGNITFETALWAYNPGGLDLSGTSLLAPFFGDVDTRPAGSGIVTYGPGTLAGRTAFGATWNQVGYYYYGDDKLNTFQVVLVDRSDIGAGDFDIYFNYDQIQWDTADTHTVIASRVGYSNGDDVAYEIEGSGEVGELIDGGENSLSEKGVLVFEVRGGEVTVVDEEFAEFILALPRIRRLVPFVEYTRTKAGLRLARGLDVARTAGETSPLLALLHDILDPQEMGDVLESLVPYAAALPTQLIFDGAHRAHSVFARPPAIRPPADGPEVNERLWVSPFGAYIDEDARAARPAYEYWSAGALVGADLAGSSENRFGVALGYEHTDFDIDSELDGSGDIQTIWLGSYYRSRLDAFDLQASMLGGFHAIDVRRQTGLGANKGDTDGLSLSGRAGAGYSLALGDRATLRPHASLLYGYLKTDGYREEGAELSALVIEDQTEHSLKSEIGMGATINMRLANREAVFGVLAGYSRELLYDRHELEAAFSETPNSDFRLHTDTSARDIVYGGLSLELALRPDLTLGMEGKLLTSSTVEQVAGKAVLTWWW